MKLPNGLGHLTYCTNVHPGETWAEVRANLDCHVLRVRDRLAGTGSFGVGLRLSAVAADELVRPETLREFKNYLAENDLYVFTLNGFPYGAFHGRPVKSAVYLPDWLDAERLRYTCVLADILAEIMPAEADLAGSISTVPGAFKECVSNQADVERMADLLIDAAAHLAAIEDKTGRTLALALEPEPCCYLETIAETVSFFRDHLFAQRAIDRFASRTGLLPARAPSRLRRHLGICLDLCHAAVEFEDLPTAIAALRTEDIGIFKMQISAGLRFPSIGPATAELLRPFDDGVYLHQVVERRGEQLVRYVDLDDALPTLNTGGEREWRVHFHVPIFADALGAFGTTQSFVEEALTMHRAAPLSQHLEVETYTWGVMPEMYGGEDIVANIVREMAWAHQRLAR